MLSMVMMMMVMNSKRISSSHWKAGKCLSHPPQTFKVLITHNVNNKKSRVCDNYKNNSNNILSFSMYVCMYVRLSHIFNFLRMLKERVKRTLAAYVDTTSKAITNQQQQQQQSCCTFPWQEYERRKKTNRVLLQHVEIEIIMSFNYADS